MKFYYIKNQFYGQIYEFKKFLFSLYYINIIFSVLRIYIKNKHHTPLKINDIISNLLNKL